VRSYEVESQATKPASVSVKLEIGGVVPLVATTDSEGVDGGAHHTRKPRSAVATNGIILTSDRSS